MLGQREKRAGEDGAGTVLEKFLASATLTNLPARLSGQEQVDLEERR